MKAYFSLWTGILTTSLIFSSDLYAEEVGIAVGEKAPAFQLTSQGGQEISLAELTAKNDKVALAFFRSADWCPFCQRQLIGLQEDLETLEDAGIQLVGISYDSVEVLERFTKKHAIEFALLSDPGSKTIDAYGIRNRGVRPGRAEGIPHPTIFLVDGKGVVTAKLQEESYRDRPTVEQIVAAAKAMD